VLTTRLGRFGGLCVRIHTAECGYCNDRRGSFYGGTEVWGQAVRVAKGMALY